MKVIAISGSPRKNGNTETLLKQSLEIISGEGIETEFIPLAGKNIQTCKACMGCSKQPHCVIKDDFDEIFQSMVNADGIIVGSSVYYSSATGEMTALLDRAGYVAAMNGRLFDRKVGGPITVGRRMGQNFTFAQMLLWYMINGMVVPGSSYWNIAFGKEKDDVLKDTEGLDTIQNFSENIVWLLKKING